MNSITDDNAFALEIQRANASAGPCRYVTGHNVGTLSDREYSRCRPEISTVVSSVNPGSGSH